MSQVSYVFCWPQCRKVQSFSLGGFCIFSVNFVVAFINLLQWIRQNSIDAIIESSASEEHDHVEENQ